ncbi:hypothetical protein GCM10025864_28440 [Luteimicrobium album]|uniref:dTDP-4-dehydrorhamnose reductase n=1 Tax=Luteimicrobium album TaxID=1054550 RepID=A0ABQ6I3K6_9MICO|nr:hypothetical protein GCM10025864_28440 [Luteimicrobium album]
MLAASLDHLVLRTAWLYGAGGGNFPKTIVRVARERGGVDVVVDQRGQPTWTRDVADLAVRLVAAEAPGGIYHATSSGDATWFDFARAAVASVGRDPEAVRPTTSEAFVRPAPARPTPCWGTTRCGGSASSRSATGASAGPRRPPRSSRSSTAAGIPREVYRQPYYVADSVSSRRRR